jgi:hypothetical protein
MVLASVLMRGIPPDNIQNDRRPGGMRLISLSVCLYSVPKMCLRLWLTALRQLRYFKVVN